MITQKNKRLLVIVITVGCLLMIPLIAMQFNTGVDWSGLDFLLAAILLTSLGLGTEAILRKHKTITKRFIFLGILIIAFLLFWAELAVGIFGSPIAGS